MENLELKLKPKQRAHSPNNYIYLEASENDRAKLISPPIKTGTSICLSFYYFLNGIDIQSIDIFVNKRLIWRDSRNDFTQWQRAEVSIDFESDSVVMFYLRGNGIYSDIAIDSISVTQCACSQKVKFFFEFRITFLPLI